MTTAPTKLDPLALMSAMILEDGRAWGQAAYDWQQQDARAILARADDAPRRHYLLRGRGMSKTTDVAALALALLLSEAPPRSHSHAYAVSTDQVGFFMDAIAGFVGRTPGLAGAVDLQTRSVTVRSSGATLVVESSDGASAYGTRPWLTVVDELGSWPTSTNHRRLWSAIVSAVPKVPNSRLLVIGTAGSPTGLGATVWAEAEKDTDHWRTSRRAGPSPWWTTHDTDSTRASLTPAEWRRLILCEWAEGDDALTSPEDVNAAIRSGSLALPPRHGLQYVASLDVGTRRDLTAFAVGHAEHTRAGRIIVIDRVLSWKPDASRGERVDLQEVESSVLRLCFEYGARLRFDRMQAEQLTSNLSRAGVRCEEYIFSAAGANRLARTLYGALRDRALSLPDDDETREEFLTARLVETGPSTVKMSNPPGSHDDIVTAVAMIAADLAAQPDYAGTGRITVPQGNRADRRRAAQRLPLSRTRSEVAMRRSATRGPRGVIAIQAPGSANDPSSVQRR